MIKEVLYMGRWRVFDSIMHQARMLKNPRNRNRRTIVKIVLWTLGLIAIIMIMGHHKHRRHY